MASLFDAVDAAVRMVQGGRQKRLDALHRARLARSRKAAERRADKAWCSVVFGNPCLWWCRICSVN
eukprot:9085986-Lingulodinium_polyedra.AAC.1